MTYDYEIKGYIVRWFNGKSHSKRFDTESAAVIFAKEKANFCASGNVQIIQERYIVGWQC